MKKEQPRHDQQKGKTAGEQKKTSSFPFPPFPVSSHLTGLHNSTFNISSKGL
jgi:hypothetical protein